MLRLATTIFARSSTVLLQHAESLPISSKDTLIFTISSNTDPSVIQHLISIFGRRTSKSAVGCVSYPSPIYPSLSYCSIATFSSSLAVPFRSIIGGKAPISLGRWQRPGTLPSANNQDTAVLERILDSGNGFNDIWNYDASLKGDDIDLPSELRKDRDRIKSLLYFSDNAPEGLMSSLNRHLPDIPKLGLIGTFTPFVTGLDQTLVRGSKPFGSGAVGLALLGETQPKLDRGFHGLKAISKTYTITSSASNLIYELDGKNPTKEALVAYDSVPLTEGETPATRKAADMYLGVVSDGTGSQTEARPSGFDMVYRLSAGGPSRGTISVDADVGPPTGSRVQFLHKPMLQVADATVLQAQPGSIQFVAASSVGEHGQEGQSGDVVRDSLVLEDVFVAHSENGVLISAPPSPGQLRPASTWRCTVPDSWGSLRWPTD